MKNDTLVTYYPKDGTVISLRYLREHTRPWVIFVHSSKGQILETQDYEEWEKSRALLEALHLVHRHDKAPPVIQTLISNLWNRISTGLLKKQTE